MRVDDNITSLCVRRARNRIERVERRVRGALEGVLQVDAARLSGPDLERLRDNILKLRNLILECSPQAGVLFAEWAEANPGREPTEQELRDFLAPIGYGSVRIHFLAW